MMPSRPKSAAGYTTASSIRSRACSKNTIGVNLPKIKVSSKSPNNQALKGILKQPTTNIAKS